ncbi:2-aminoethylphosphonate--pyruvate transaminase [Symmachiella dynata]|uniref:2-aminoethylphosphonate--pyruvate transaminase n=1 Tax=Symmachiella dynata TaxID=2527995 RepID=UPI00118BB658|nr:2-aminoethylphosphonate--pyruvate transaminase [Symmachiella dynata]QDT47565.1 2-aminoethylphosphonate--pyruvate transaminase [Symmachiella dynata]
MNSTPSTPPDKVLFTPGPLSTSPTVKQAMLRDVGSWDQEFIDIVQRIRSQLLTLAGVSKAAGYEAVPLQGSGSFGVEAAIGCGVPPGGKMLSLVNGAYGERIVKMAQHLKIDQVVLRTEEHEIPDVEKLRQTLADDAEITNVIVVHCETTTGIVNPIEEIGNVVAAAGRIYTVDAMSSFGALPIDLPACHIDYLISSANKCLQGVPGFSFVLARRAVLEASEGHARSLCLDLLDQWQAFETHGRFRYSPPTHSFLALEQALVELEAEGGMAGRAARYEENRRTLIAGMRRLGFREYLQPEQQSCIISTFHYPADPKFDFDTFYNVLKERGSIIYPGKLGDVDCFRIGTIGHMFPADVENLLAAIEDAIAVMELDMTMVASC